MPPSSRASVRPGAVILGKTNMVEFAFSGVGINPHFGTPGNATDPTRIPGGSSSGAGVTVAEGTSDISIGSDTGGSIRIPAALNGVVGFKPTARRIPLTGAFPLSYTLDSLGPLARSVAECAAADAILAGEAHEPLRARSRCVVCGSAYHAGGCSLKSSRWSQTAFESALTLLSGAGARVADISVEDLLQDMRDATARTSIASIEAAAVHQIGSTREPPTSIRACRSRSHEAATFPRPSISGCCNAGMNSSGRWMNAFQEWTSWRCRPRR